MSDDIENNGEDGPEEVEQISGKELAKLKRKQAYQKAKEARKKDPKYLAMKERAKEQRRAAYQRQKEYMKSKKAAAKKEAQDEKVKEKDEKAAEFVAELVQDKPVSPPKLRLIKNDNL